MKFKNFSVCFTDTGVPCAGKRTEKKDRDDYSYNKVRAITISICLLPLLLTCIGLVIKNEVKKRRERDEPAVVEDNMYYGDDYYDHEMETRVVDTNDYYGV